MTTVELAASHILGQLTEQRPLFVAVQGPQGSGKSYLSAKVQNHLRALPHSLHVVILSIDDLYLPHEALVSLAAAYPQNVLWKGRGQPGTHDVDLGVKTLSALKAGEHKVKLPQFDKSLFAGEGDRLPLDDVRLILVEQPPPLDIVIVEGWCVGFYPISEDALLGRWNDVWKFEREKLGLGEEEMGTLEDVRMINHMLKDYIRFWSFFNVFLQVNNRAHLIVISIDGFLS
jgi:D-glycerate 3-kinase